MASDDVQFRGWFVPKEPGANILNPLKTLADPDILEPTCGFVGFLVDWMARLANLAH